MEQEGPARIKDQGRGRLPWQGSTLGLKISPDGVGIVNTSILVGAKIVDVLMWKRKTVQPFHGPGPGCSGERFQRRAKLARRQIGYLERSAQAVLAGNWYPALLCESRGWEQEQRENETAENRCKSDFHDCLPLGNSEKKPDRLGILQIFRRPGCLGETL
jgi:hypothetical protein